MPSSTREIRRRIKSITNIKKITKAMELVAASKMRKATGNVLASRSYANVSWETILHLSKKIKADINPLLRQKSEINKIALVAIASNRGLCGGFNNQIVQKAVQFIRAQENKNIQIDIITLGKKCYSGIARLKYKIFADFEKKDITLSITDIYPISHLLLEEYIKGNYDKVVIVYTDYISALMQKPKLFTLLPLSIAESDEDLGSVGQKQIEAKTEKLEIKKEEDREYLLEPNPIELLNIILPKIIEIRLYQAVLESDASEHSARMMAMKNANESATEMINELTLMYNQARQAAITKEISEISAGKAALE